MKDNNYFFPFLHNVILLHVIDIQWMFLESLLKKIIQITEWQVFQNLYFQYKQSKTPFLLRILATGQKLNSTI